MAKKRAEKNNENKIKSVILGLDISSSIVGITVLDFETGNTIDIFPIVLNKEEDLLDKAAFFEAEIGDYLDTKNFNVIAVGFEDFAKKFSGGASSIQTILTLARFNGHVEKIMWEEIGFKPTLINVRTARKLANIVTSKENGDIKVQILNQVKAKLEIEGLDPWIYVTPTRGKNKGQKTLATCNFDMADSWVIAKSLWLLNQK